MFIGKDYKSIGYSRQVNIVTAKGLDLHPDCRAVVLHAEKGDIRWRDDGANPTSSVGMRIKKGNSLIYMGELQAFKFIGAHQAAILNITYYR